MRGVIDDHFQVGLLLPPHRFVVRREMIDLKPIMQTSDQGYQLLYRGWLYEVGIRSQLERTLHVLDAHRGGQGDNSQVFELRVFANPLQHGKAVLLRHVQVQQHDRRQ